MQHEHTSSDFLEEPPGTLATIVRRNHKAPLTLVLDSVQSSLDEAVGTLKWEWLPIFADCHLSQPVQPCKHVKDVPSWPARYFSVSNSLGCSFIAFDRFDNTVIRALLSPALHAGQIIGKFAQHGPMY